MKLNVKEKLAGLLVPVFALRHTNDLGIGDTVAVKQAIDFCARHKIGVLQVLPINETGGDNSPYNAISSVALDPMYIDVEPSAIPGLDAAEFKKLVTPEVLGELRKGSVKYGKVKKLKIELLQKAFANFEVRDLKAKSKLANSFVQFREGNTNWLPSYTLFRTLIDKHGGDTRWPLWEEQFRSYESAKKAAAAPDHKEDFDRTATFWAYVQWLAWEQWMGVKAYATEKSVDLMGDLPFGVSRYSWDVWAHPELFQLEWSCGVPPETYFKGDVFIQKWGQNWGMPFYDWAAHKKENFKWWRQRVQSITSLFHHYRIDHVLGFFRVYGFPWIPERNEEFVNLTKEEAKELTGGKLPHFLPREDEPVENALQNCADGEAILRILMDASGSSAIVAEDLGVVPKYVRPLLKKLGIPGFAIPFFERVKNDDEVTCEEDRNFKPKETLPELSLITYATHDHNPIARYYADLVKWWHSENGHEGWLEVRRVMRFLGLNEDDPPKELTAQLHAAFMKALLDSPCWLAVMMVTDLLGTAQRFNEPGLSGEESWSQRLEKPLDEYESDPDFGGKIETFSQLIERSNRLKPVHKSVATTK